MLFKAATALFAMMYLSGTVQGETLSVYAAGSLKMALGDAARAYEAANPGTTIVSEFGASGLMRERIEQGEKAHLFVSADMAHPQKLVEQGKAAAPVVRVTRNVLCALAREKLTISPASLLETIMQPDIRLGISTPKADPSGDYALAMFAKAGTISKGVTEALEAKAQQLTGGATSPKAPDGSNLYAWVIKTGQADVFLTYCTNAKLAKAEIPSLQIVDLPPALSVGADYGMVVLTGAPANASGFAAYLSGREGQSIFAKYGFTH